MRTMYSYALSCLERVVLPRMLSLYSLDGLQVSSYSQSVSGGRCNTTGSRPLTGAGPAVAADSIKSRDARPSGPGPPTAVRLPLVRRPGWYVRPSRVIVTALSHFDRRVA